MRLLYSVFLTAALLPGPPARAEGPNGARIGAPSLGLMYDNTTAGVRRISGTAGAAVIGESLNPGFPVAKMAIAGKQHYLLATSAEDGLVRVVRFDGLSAVHRVIDGGLASPARIVLSPSEQSAVLYDEQSSRMQVVTGLPDDPVVVREFSTANLGIAATDPAVSDDGKRVLFAAASLWLFDADAGLAQLPVTSRVAAICFRAGGQEGLAASDTGELYLIDASGAVSSFQHAVPASAAVPVAVRMSPEGKRGYVAFDNGLLAVADSTSGETKSIACQCKPGGLRSLNAPGMFALNEDSPLLLFDVSGASPRFWFVPQDRSVTEAPESAQ